MLSETTPLTVQTTPVHALVFAASECYYIDDARNIKIEDGLVGFRNSTKRNCSYWALSHGFYGEKVDYLVRIPISTINFRIHEGIEKPKWVDITKEQIDQNRREETRKLEDASKKCIDAVSELNSNLTKEEEAARIQRSLKLPFFKKLAIFLGL